MNVKFNRALTDSVEKILKSAETDAWTEAELKDVLEIRKTVVLEQLLSRMSSQAAKL